MPVPLLAIVTACGGSALLAAGTVTGALINRKTATTHLNKTIDDRFKLLIKSLSDEVTRLSNEVTTLRAQNGSQQAQIDTLREEKQVSDTRIQKLESGRVRDRNLIRRLIDWIKSTALQLPEEIQREINDAGHGESSGSQH